MGIAAGLVIMLYDSIVGAVENFINTLFSTQYEAVVIDKLVTAHYEKLHKRRVKPR